jgi:hypothetical protein
MQLNFDASQHDPSQVVTICLPLADYPFQIVSAEVEAVTNKPNEGLLKIGLAITDGPYKGAIQYDRFNIYNANPQAVAIAHKELSALCHVVNRMRLATEKDLIGGTALAKIGPQANNDKYSEVKQYMYPNGSLPGGQPAQQPVQPAPVQQQAAQGQVQGFQQPHQQQQMPFGQPAVTQPPPFGAQPQQGGGFQPAPPNGASLPPWAK